MPLTPDDMAAGITEGDTGEASLLSDLIRNFLRVKKQHDAAEAEAKAAARRMSELSREITEKMVEEGIDSPPAVDGHSVWIKPTTYVEYRTNPDTGDPYKAADLAEVLPQVGLGHLVKTVAVNGNSLRAALKEIIENGDPLPGALAPYLGLGERFDVQAAPLGGRKSARSPRRPSL